MSEFLLIAFAGHHPAPPEWAIGLGTMLVCLVVFQLVLLMARLVRRSVHPARLNSTTVNTIFSDTTLPLKEKVVQSAPTSKTIVLDPLPAKAAVVKTDGNGSNGNGNNGKRNDGKKELRIDFAVGTVGKETGNDDAYLTGLTSAILADGVSTTSGSDQVSRAVCEHGIKFLEAWPEFLTEEDAHSRMEQTVVILKKLLVQQAEDEILEASAHTTAVLLKFFQDPEKKWHYIVSSIGDSRCYKMNSNGEMVCLTLDGAAAYRGLSTDQAWDLQKRIANAVSAQDLGDDDLKCFAVRHVIDCGLCGDPEIEAELFIAVGIVSSGDLFFLSSDGVHDPLADWEISAHISQRPTIQTALNAILNRATKRMAAYKESHAHFRAKRPDDATAILIATEESISFDAHLKASQDELVKV